MKEEERQEKRKRIEEWNKDLNRKYTRSIIEDIFSLVFEDYKDPTENMGIGAKEEFRKLSVDFFKNKIQGG